MLLDKNVKLDFHDLRVKPAKISYIVSRSQISPFYYHKNKDEYLPIFTAPMDTVIDIENVNLFKECKIHSIIPRGEEKLDSIISFSDKYSDESRFRALGLDEFIKEFLRIDDMDFYFISQNTSYILIDMANGHMQKLIDTAKEAKRKYGEKLVLMVGNIANPETYEIFAELEVDYVRIGIGNGNACLTTKQTTVGYPMASLIKECSIIKKLRGFNTKIVADGGMKDFSDVILALALGADYVMIGSLFNKSLESCGDTYLFGKIKINQYSWFAKWLLKNNFKLTKKFRGMSTKEVQRKWSKKVIRTSEGVSKKQKVEYTLKQWTENFEDYLRSTMSYSNAINLNQFIGNVETIEISDKAYERFNK